jgi:methyltransferase (TIGR00027 family)
MAVARAYETTKAEPLFVDSYARVFLDEAIQAGWTPPPTSALQMLPGDPRLDARTVTLMNYAACRTAYFDQFFVSANLADISQVVVLGAGLDSRPWRLRWTPGTVVYEIDQPQVLDFKVNTLWMHNDEPACDYRPVPADLRSDWPEALRGAGYDPSEPSAWSAEGLLSYLPSAARQLLFDRVHAQSSRGSRIAVEAASTAPRDAPTVVQRPPAIGDTRDASAPNRGTTLQEIRSLWFPDRGDDFAGWLAQSGWQVTSIEASELMAHYGRAPSADTRYALPRSAFLDGTKRR